MDEGRYYGDGVGNEMYQLQLVVVEKTPEEITRGEVEARLKERRKDDLLLHVLGRELHSHRRLPLHLLLRPQQPVVHQRLDIGLRHCRWHPHSAWVQNQKSFRRHFLARVGSRSKGAQGLDAHA
jgi:hypothetical protein